MRREIRLSRRILASGVRREWRNRPGRALIGLDAVEIGSMGGSRSGAGAKSATRSCSESVLFFEWVGRIVPPGAPSAFAPSAGAIPLESLSSALAPWPSPPPPSRLLAMVETTPYVTVSAVIRSAGLDHDLGVHDAPISAFTMLRSRRSRCRSRCSRCRDLGVHDAAISAFTMPISVFTMLRSRRSRCRDLGVHDAARYAARVRGDCWPLCSSRMRSAASSRA